MKKTTIRIMFSIAGLIVLLILCARGITMKVNSNFATEALLEFHYGDSNISAMITDEDDILVLKQLLNGQSYFRNSLHCGFTTNISITMISGKKSIMFCTANDGCQLLRIGTSSKYIEISYEDRERLNEILKKYGMIFPCV